MPAPTLTAEAARAAAEWLKSRSPGMAFDLRAEADRLDTADRTPGQVAFEMTTMANPRPGWGGIASDTKTYWERIAAAVIAHHVGPDRLVVGRVDVENMIGIGLGTIGPSRLRLREALS